SNAIDAAIGRYNAENLQITFTRVASGGDINIKLINGGNYIASAGFPSGGDPYGEVKFNKQYQNYSAGFLTTVISHEMGHCIGFRHTDYMNRAYSCGSGGNEGQTTTGVGAVLIPGTPSGPDAASWMLACLSATTNRPFNSNDKKALDYLY
ncbi:MAG TPA: M57 family metalloprotease, partial [Chitinophagaceae bacterium]